MCVHVCVCVNQPPYNYVQAPISTNCFLDVKHEEDNLDEFLSRFRTHPQLQPITYIRYVSEDEREQVAIGQPFWSTGSLRDVIYGEVRWSSCVCCGGVSLCGVVCQQTDPTRDWADKYTAGGTPLPVEKVARYGRQILEVRGKN